MEKNNRISETIALRSDDKIMEIEERLYPMPTSEEFVLQCFENDIKDHIAASNIIDDDNHILHKSEKLRT